MLVTDEQMDRWADEGTGRDHYASGRSRLAYGYILYLFTVCIVFMCFYHAEW